MSLTREDKLRELELLPAWKLRTVTPMAVPSVAVAPDQAVVAVKLSTAPSPQPSPTGGEGVIILKQTDWLFVGAVAGVATQLLSNMLAAIQLKSGVNVHIADVSADLTQTQPKLIVALGASAAQSLLGMGGSLVALRGKLHDFQGVPVIVTYHPDDLLLNAHDKAHAWEDLCFARATMRGLQTDAL
ncbi:MAG: uracil-DNA glycosylase family protein [Methylophilaceae bacterium]